MSSDTALALLHPLYEAATQPEMWEVFLRKASEMLRADHASFILHDPENDHTKVKIDLGYTEEMRHDAEEMTKLNPWIPEIRKHEPTGWFSGGVEDVMSMAEYRKTSFYNDFYRKHKIEWAAATVVFGPKGSMPSLVVSRSELNSPFSAADKQLLKDLIPHLGRVFKVGRMVTALRERNAAGQHALDLIGAACVTFDEDRRVSFMNRRAELLIGEGATIHMKDRRLLVANTVEQGALDDCVASACAFGAGKSSDPGPGAVVLHSIKGTPMYISTLPYHSSWELLEGRPSALLFITTQEERGHGEHRLWHTMFELSPAECRVAEMMKQGMEVAEISDAIKIRVDTVRYYQKSVYRKTGVRGQGPLLRLLTRLPSSNSL